MKTKIYLSYAMQFVADEELQKQRVSQFRDRLIELGFDVYNPYTDEDHIFTMCGCSSRKEFLDLQSNDHKAFIECMRKIRKYDIEQLESSDLVIAFIDPITSGGLSGELTIAAYTDIQVYGIVDPANYKNISGWVLSCCDSLFETTDELIELVKKNIHVGFYQTH